MAVAYQTSLFAYQGAGQFAYQEIGGVPPVVVPPPGGGKRPRHFFLKKYKRIALEAIYQARREQLEPTKRLQVATRKVAEDLARPGVDPMLQETLVSVLLPFVRLMDDLQHFSDTEVIQAVDWKAVAADVQAVPQLIELHQSAEADFADPKTPEDDDDDWLLLVS